MRVTPIAHTMIDWEAIRPIISGTAFADAEYEYDTVTSADHLGEFAGRSCYKSYDRPRPETATTESYLGNIIDQGHFSVLEHASVTFHVKDVSRSLLTELNTHRHLSRSVESQRYVDQAVSHPGPVPPPAVMTGPAAVWAELQRHYADSLDRYMRTVSILQSAGYSRKQAREAARAFLPNATPVDLVVTGNLRAWRDFLGKRHHIAADAEMQEFASEILRHLREIAPLSVQDIPAAPYGADPDSLLHTTTEIQPDNAAYRPRHTSN